MHTVAVCDTEPIAIEGLRRLLESVDGVRVVAAETALPKGMEAARELTPSVLILDKAFGFQPVLTCLAELSQGAARPAAIVWGMGLSAAEVARYLEAGCAGVVSKTGRLESIISCIRTVAGGGTWIEGGVIHAAVRALAGPQDNLECVPIGAADVAAQEAPGRSLLTRRERQVMELVERGMKNREVAFALGIRTGTVKIHLRHIFEKTGVHGRYSLVLAGLKERGLLPPAVM